MSFLGIDTSNYTASCALFSDEDGGEYKSVKRPLPVKNGEIGLRQSDAVFEATRLLPDGLTELFGGNAGIPEAVGVSVRPTDEDGSYMPCFLAGRSAAYAAARVCGIPAFEFSHQAGHVAAAMFGAGAQRLRENPFLAFHLSGGTTQALYIEPGYDKPFNISKASGSRDLKAGQAIDRVGRMLSLPFPAGPSLEQLALLSEREYRIRPTMKDGDCCLSGVENKCADMKRDGVADADIAKYCISSICAAVRGMAQYLIEKYGALPLIFSGGVSGNIFLKNEMKKEFGALFAPPELSSDNAVGIALLTCWKSKGNI